MATQLGIRSSAFATIYPTNSSTGVLQVETVSTVNDTILASYRAINAGTGYAVGDIILFRQVGTDPPSYYNGNTAIADPSPADLGPLAVSSNVSITSNVLAPDASSATLQLATNTILNDIQSSLPVQGSAGSPTSTVTTVQGINGGTPINVSGSVTSVLSPADSTTLSGILTKVTEVDNKLVAGSPIGAVTVTNGLASNAVNIQDGGNSLTIDGSVDLTGIAAVTLSNINGKIPTGLSVSNNRLVVDNTQQVQTVTGTVTANTGLAQPMTDAQLRATPPTFQLTNLQLNTLTPPAALVDTATETTLVKVLDAVEGNINFNETIWTDNSGTFFARRVTQVGGVVSVNYYLPDGSGYTPGVNPRPAAGDPARQIVTSFYVAIATALPNYKNTDSLTRIDVLNTNTSAVASTLWFNVTTQTYIPAPASTDVQLITTADTATAANQVLLQTAIGAKGDAIATTDTGTFSLIALIKRGLQNWTSLLQRIPNLGAHVQAASLPVTLASDQPAILTTVTDGTNDLQLLNLVNSKPVPAAIVDSSGNQISSFGSVQYTEGDAIVNAIGTVSLWKDATDILTAVSATKPLPIDLNTSSILGTPDSTTADTNALLLNPGLSLDAISLLKAIAVTNRQVLANTQVWTSGTVSDETAGFDKTFTVPADVNYHILFGSIEGITDSNIVERALKIEVIHTNNSILYSTYASTTQDNDKTFNYYLSGCDSNLIPSKNTVQIQMPMSLILYTGQRIRFYFENGTGSDNLLVRLQLGVR